MMQEKIIIRYLVKLSKGTYPIFNLEIRHIVPFDNLLDMLN